MSLNTYTTARNPDFTLSIEINETSAQTEYTNKMPIPSLKRSFNSLSNFSWRRLPCSESNSRNLSSGVEGECFDGCHFYNYFQEGLLSKYCLCIEWLQ